MVSRVMALPCLSGRTTARLLRRRRQTVLRTYRSPFRIRLSIPAVSATYTQPLLARAQITRPEPSAQAAVASSGSSGSL